MVTSLYRAILEDKNLNFCGGQFLQDLKNLSLQSNLRKNGRPLGCCGNKQSLPEAVIQQEAAAVIQQEAAENQSDTQAHLGDLTSLKYPKQVTNDLPDTSRAN